MIDQYHFITNQIDRYYPKDPNDADKYLVCTCARGENEYLVEYVDHYLGLGFDKVVICDNNSDTSVEDLLADYIANGQVEVFDCRGFDSFQVQFYSMFAHEGNYAWCGYFDADEFLELGVYSDIKEFLANIEEDCVSFNWIVYGSNGQKHKTAGRVQDRFPIPVLPLALYKENVFIKSILRGGYDRFHDIWFNGSHIPMCSNEDIKYNIGGYHVVDYQSHTHFPPRYKCGYIKHYYTKSFDEWIKKASRGWPDGTPNLAASNFFACENEYEYPIEKYLTAFFINKDALDALPLNCTAMLDEYDVIQVTNSDKQVYAFAEQVVALMSGTTDHTFVITDPHIDDTLFNVLLEFAMRTGNRLVYSNSNEETWKVYMRYGIKGGTYYIIDFK